MKISQIFYLMTMAVASCDPPSKSDSLLRTEILGSWSLTETQLRESGGSHIELTKNAREDFSSDGTISIRARFSQTPGIGSSAIVTATGTWEIENGILKTRVIESSFESLLQPGLVTVEQIVAIEDGKLRTRNEKGDTLIRYRAD